MKDYNFREIEKKWQDIWDREKTFKATVDHTKKSFMPWLSFLTHRVRVFMLDTQGPILHLI